MAGKGIVRPHVGGARSDLAGLSSRDVAMLFLAGKWHTAVLDKLMQYDEHVRDAVMKRIKTLPPPLRA